MECSKFMRACGEKLANAGYAVFGLDYEGHGRSAGVRGLINRIDNIVDDCEEFFRSIYEFEEYEGKAKFLYGDSLGGAVCLQLHRRDPSFWDGAVLVAPMCKISEKLFKPLPGVLNVLTKIEDIIPKWKIVPTKNIIDSAFKDPTKREAIRSNKLIYQDKPRLKTAMEMLRVSTNIGDHLHEVTLPFLLLQGEKDIVTDPAVSKALYEQASSTDKTIKLYDGMCHGIATGESDENIAIVFSDIITWLDERATEKDF
ncbi:caffeoylshikimate esterase-like isoform X2 [Abrus precatorius]|nr:caffeoylshikimate esterase-like isoform X2 [Abrus precatorius]